jgi:monofunctional biosynthetic peptidoglycan transglycosylase
LLGRIPFWIRIPILLVVGFHLLCAAALVSLRFINPFTTGVQMQRRVEGLFSATAYTKRSTFVPLGKISTHLQHAAIAAEDGRFYQHYGIDWQQVELVLEEAAETGEPPRGASTITQQLVKNLFFTTHRNPVRKVLEYTLAPMASVILGKRRVLELYLNIVEWGPGVWGAEAASQYHYQIPASRLDRDQAARLVACLPAPRRRRPARMDSYSSIIHGRMAQLGW